MNVHVLSPGLLSSIQDTGRHGFRHLGVGSAGAMDAYSHAIANLLVGNPVGAPVLEITMAGPRLRIQRATRIALCGADIVARCDGRDLAGWRTIDLPAGSELKFTLANVRLGDFSLVPELLSSPGTQVLAAPDWQSEK